MFFDALSIIATGSFVGASCAMLGSFLVLRRLAMLGDAISHAVLPGIAIAFLLTTSRSSLPMFVGAAALGGLTAFLVEFLSRRGVQGDAAIGVTFTSLFAIGVVLVSLYGSSVDLDLECVLYGEIAYAPFDTIVVGGRDLGPRALWVNGTLFLINLLVILALYKQFKLCAFDAEMAAAVGINVGLMHYVLMALVAVTTVGAFESVGAILVVGMLVVPAATAYLLTDQLGRMLVIAVGLGVASSVTGYGVARTLDASIAGSMASVSGLFFAITFFFAPSQGLVSRWWHRLRLRQRVAEEDVLLWAGRRREAMPRGFQPTDLEEEIRASTLPSVLGRLARTGLLAREGSRYLLTEKGAGVAVALLRRHRVYESYLEELGYPPDHVHDPADRVEHYIPPGMTDDVDAATNYPDRDPHDRPIPRTDPRRG